MVGKNLNIIFEKLRETGLVKNKKDFCEKLGADFRHYSKYVNGELTFYVTSKNYSKLRSLDISIEFLLIGKGRPLQKNIDLDNQPDTLKDFLPILIELAKLDRDQRQGIIDTIKTKLK